MWFILDFMLFNFTLMGISAGYWQYECKRYYTPSGLTERANESMTDRLPNSDKLIVVSGIANAK